MSCHATLFENSNLQTPSEPPPTIRQGSPLEEQQLLRRIVPSSPDKNSKKLEQQLAEIHAEERALESLHIELKSAFSRSSRASVSTNACLDDIQKKEEESIQERFRALENAQAALQAERDRLLWEAESREKDKDRLTAELAEISSAKETAEQALSEKQDEVTSLYDTKALLEQELVQAGINQEVYMANTELLIEAKTQILALSASLQSAQEELATARSLLEQSQQQESALRNTVEEMQSRESSSSQERDQTVGVLRTKLLTMQEHVSELGMQLEDARRDRDTSLVDMKKSLEHKHIQAEATRRRNEDLEKALRASERINKDTQTEVESMRMHVQSSQKRIAELQEALNHAQGQSNSLKETSDSQHAQMQDTERRTSALQTALDSAVKDCEEAKMEVERMQKKLQASEQHERELEAQLAESVVGWTNRDAEMAEKIEQGLHREVMLKHSVEDMQAQVDGVHQELQQALQREADLNNTVETARAQLQASEEMHAQLTSALEESKAEVLELGAALDHLTEHTKELRNRRASELAEADSIVRAAEGVEAENEALRTSRDAVQAHCDSLIASAQREKARMAAMEQDVQGKNEECARLQADVAKMDAELEELRTELQAQIRTFNEEKEESEEQLNAVKTALEDTERERDLWLEQAQSSEQQILVCVYACASCICGYHSED
jgi:chromosome segregation ATPase